MERVDSGAAVYAGVRAIDGPQTMVASLIHIDMLTVLSLLYLAFIATIVGYGIWGSLLGRYETWRVAPLSLLVPVVDGQRRAVARRNAERLAAAGRRTDYGRAVYQCFRPAGLADGRGSEIRKALISGQGCALHRGALLAMDGLGPCCGQAQC